MKKYLHIVLKHSKIIGLCLLLVLVDSCSKVALTGRRQINLLPDSQLMAMSVDSYGTFLRDNKLSTNAQQTAMVKNCGNRIRQAVEKYMRDNGLEKELKNFQWEFNLVEDPSINAWCMPGGKVVFYTGILPVCENETGVAVVMGHEIAHAVAKHGNERMSQGLLAQLGGVGLSVALRDKPQQTQSLFMTAYGVGSQVGVLLPFGRLQESEADEMGLIFMAMAGYDPRESVAFWGRMDSAGGGGTPEFLSTHPSHSTRIKKLNELMPKALEYYKP